MILTCPKCATRLRLELTALPDSNFNVLCPKCQTTISVVPSAASKSVGASVHNHPQSFHEPLPATAHNTSAATAPAPAPPTDTPRNPAAQNTVRSTGSLTSRPAEQNQDQMTTLINMLASAMTQSAAINGAYRTNSNPDEFYRRRNVLICLGSQDDVNQVCSVLKNHEYEVMPVESSEQALEKLQYSNKVDIVLLSPDFQTDTQGTMAVLRFISALSPDRRRRLFLVMISPNCRTADVRTAFNQGVNLVVNAGEFHLLPLAMTKGIHDFNQLYRSFNEASNVPPF